MTVTSDKAEMKKSAPLKIKADSHRRLEEAVLDIFSTSDFHKASMRAIAKQAGISFSTIYGRYGCKERLLFDFIDDWLADLTERMIDHLQGIAGLKEKLRKVFWVQLDFWERNPAKGKILFMTLPRKTWFEDKTFPQEKMIDIFLDVLRQGQREGGLKPDVRPGVFVDVMYGIIMHSFCMWIYRQQEYSLTGQSNALFEIFWGGVSSTEN